MSDQQSNPNPASIEGICIVLAQLEGAVSTINSTNADALCMIARRMRERIRSHGVRSDDIRQPIPVTGTLEAKS